MLHRLKTVAFTAAALLVTSIASHAQDWPQRPIRIIVPFAAGGAVDATARLIGEPLGKLLNTQVVVENRAGGAALPGSEAVVRAAPDGYTLGVFSASYAANAVTQPNISFDAINDVTPISQVIVNTVLILVPADSPIKTLKDLVDQAKAKPNSISFGSVGTYSAMHFAGELLNTRAGIKMVHVPYRGAGPALNDLLAGTLPVAILGIGPVLPHIKAGKLRALAITTEKRSSLLPDVPTVAELGYPGYAFGEWFAVYAPKGLPDNIKKKLYEAVTKVATSDDFKKRVAGMGLEATSTTPDELKAYLTSEIERIRDIAKQTNMLQQKH